LKVEVATEEEEDDVVVVVVDRWGGVIKLDAEVEAEVEAEAEREVEAEAEVEIEAEAEAEAEGVEAVFKEVEETFVSSSSFAILIGCDCHMSIIEDSVILAAAGGRGGAMIIIPISLHRLSIRF